eukprot:354470-Chlamydomonas_euryale.AAC.47
MPCGAVLPVAHLNSAVLPVAHLNSAVLPVAHLNSTVRCNPRFMLVHACTKCDRADALHEGCPSGAKVSCSRPCCDTMGVGAPEGCVPPTFSYGCQSRKNLGGGGCVSRPRQHYDLAICEPSSNKGSEFAPEGRANPDYTQALEYMPLVEMPFNDLAKQDHAYLMLHVPSHIASTCD